MILVRKGGEEWKVVNDVLDGEEGGEAWRGIARLVGVCDVTGLLYHLGNVLTTNHLGVVVTAVVIRRVPLVLASLADAQSAAPFKAEWSVVRRNGLFVGSTGKEWVNANGQTDHRRMEQVYHLSTDGHLVDILNWTQPFAALRRAANASFPGYLIHEAVAYVGDDLHFFPRRRSQHTPYSEAADERAGTNVFVTAPGGRFDRLHAGTLSSRAEPGWGVTEAVHLAHAPASGHVVLLRAMEVDGQTATAVSVVDVATGVHLTSPDWLPVQTGVKYEGMVAL